MNNFCIPLNIIGNPFKENIDPTTFPRVRHSKLNHEEFFNDEIIEWFKKFNLEICLLEVFYSHPLFVGNIHRDHDRRDIVKINWIFGGEGSIMNWFELKEGRQETRIKTAIETIAIHYNKEDCNQIHSQQITRPSLVRVGIPHNVINRLKERWCISTTFRNIDTGILPTTEDSLKLFKDYIDL